MAGAVGSPNEFYQRHQRPELELRPRDYLRRFGDRDWAPAHHRPTGRHAPYYRRPLRRWDWRQERWQPHQYLGGRNWLADLCDYRLPIWALAGLALRGQTLQSSELALLQCRKTQERRKIHP